MEAERERGWPTVVVVVVMRQRAVAPAGRTGAGTLHRPPPKGTVAVGQVPFACGCSVHSPRGGGGEDRRRRRDAQNALRSAAAAHRTLYHALRGDWAAARGGLEGRPPSERPQ